MAYRDGSNRDLHNHNASIEHNVAESQDSTPDEHNYGHLYPNTPIDRSQKEEIISIKSTTNEKSKRPDEERQEPSLQRKVHPDISKSLPSKVINAENAELGHEASEVDLQAHLLSNFYIKYRIFFHLLIWLFFTG